MFEKHNPIIGRFAQSSPDNLVKVCAMVLLSIQQPWYRIGEQMSSLASEGELCPHLWGYKRKAYRHIISEKRFLHKLLLDTRAGKCEGEYCLAELASIPGLGLVKGGFVMQLTIGRAGCLDVHNLKRFALKPSAFRVSGLRFETLRGRARLYLTLCNELGGSAFLWNSWCNHLAELYPARYSGGYDVSARHCLYLGLPG